MSPSMSNTASGLPPFASTFAAISLKRTRPSPSRSSQEKWIVIVMPPSTPALIRPRSMPAPTAIVASSVASGSGLPAASFVSKKKPSIRSAGLPVAMNCWRPYVS